MSDLALNFGEGDITTKRKPIARPYGVAILVGGVDETGPKLYQIDPSGTMIGYLAKGIGSADEGIQNILDENYNAEMTIADGEKLALNCLKQAMEKAIDKELVSLCVIPADTKNLVYRTDEEIEELLKVLPDIN